MRREDSPTSSTSIYREGYYVHSIMGSRTLPPRFENDKELATRSLRLPLLTYRQRGGFSAISKKILIELLR